MSDPTTVTGMTKRWLASSLALADTTPVSSWVDTIAAEALTQSTAAWQPTYAVSGIGGKPAVLFDGVDDNLLDATGGGSVETIYAIVQFVTVGGLRSVVDSESNSFGHRFTTGSGSWTASAEGGGSIAGPAVTTDPVVLVGVFNGASSTFYLNGTLVGTYDAGTRNSSGTKLGTDPNSTSGRFSNIYMAEVGRYSRALAASDVATIDSYAQDTYGITVSDYVPSGGGGGSASFSESVPIATALARTASAKQRAMSDTVPVATTLARAAGAASRGLADSVPVATSVAAKKVLPRSTSDTVPVGSSLARSAGTKVRGLGNTLGLVSSAAVRVHLAAAMADSLPLSSSLSIAGAQLFGSMRGATVAAASARGGVGVAPSMVGAVVGVSSMRGA